MIETLLVLNVTLSFFILVVSLLIFRQMSASPVQTQGHISDSQDSILLSNDKLLPESELSEIKAKAFLNITKILQIHVHNGTQLNLEFVDVEITGKLDNGTITRTHRVRRGFGHVDIPPMTLCEHEELKHEFSLASDLTARVIRAKVLESSEARYI